MQLGINSTVLGTKPGVKPRQGSGRTRAAGCVSVLTSEVGDIGPIRDPDLQQFTRIASVKTQLGLCARPLRVPFNWSDCFRHTPRSGLLVGQCCCAAAASGAAAAAFSATPWVSVFNTASLTMSAVRGMGMLRHRFPFVRQAATTTSSLLASSAERFKSSRHNGRPTACFSQKTQQKGSKTSREGPESKLQQSEAHGTCHTMCHAAT